MDDRVKAVMAAILKVPRESLDRESSPDSIESWHSVNHLKLMMALEEEFDVSFTEDQIVDAMNFRLILLTLKEAGAAA